jgi:hypothetical protein
VYGLPNPKPKGAITMGIKNTRNLSKEEQMEHLKQAWDATHEAWHQIYKCDNSINIGSPFESIRDDINSIAVRINDLKKELLEDDSN